MLKRIKMNKSKKNKYLKVLSKKIVLIWILLISIIIIFFYLFPYKENPLREVWSIQKVITQAKKGKIISATIKSDPSKGTEWYLIRGISINNIFKEKKYIYFFSQGRLTANKFNEIIDSSSGYRIIQRPSSTFVSDIFLSILPFITTIFLLYFLLIRQIKISSKGAMSFGKSKAKLLMGDSKVITFKNIAGCNEAIEEVKEIVDFLKNPKKFENIGGKIPKGVLLVGSPGTGKTLLAKAIAGEAKVPFFTISGSDFVEMFVGVGASRVRDMFAQGKKNSPCIIFIDEIDAVGRHRGIGLGGGNDEREQTLNSLLVEMDGFNHNEGVIIIAATNRPDVLDNALLRPGRFDRQITIDLPDLNGRHEILKIHASKIKLKDNINLLTIARSTPGFSGADLANLLNESALLAARKNKQLVEEIDLDEAREKISFGRERRKLMDEEDKTITAVHEAGHAIIQAIIDDGFLPIHKVTIIPRGRSLGSTMFIPKKDILNQSKKNLLNQICCAMGGRLAEEITLGIETTGASGDILMATKIARDMVCKWGMHKSLGHIAFGIHKNNPYLKNEIDDKKDYSENTAKKIDKAINFIVENQYKRAKSILLNNKNALNIVTKELLKYETLEGKHIHEILKEGKIISLINN